MKTDMIQLPIRFGFHEYFDSRSGQGYGSSNFSWTAALFLDLIYEYYHKDNYGLERFKFSGIKRRKEKIILNQATGMPGSISKDTASNMMTCIRNLKDKFYDLTRGRIDYKAMKTSSEYGVYQETAARLQAFDPAELSSPTEKKAFWINLYNAIIVHGIVQLGINSSVREVPHFFRRISYQVGEFIFSAEDIEHGILRTNAKPPYRIFPLLKRNDLRRGFSLEAIDPRIHFALVCGSRSCAPIRFYEADVVDEQLDKATRNFINSSEVIVLPEKNKIFLSQIFHWYEKDFGKKEEIFSLLLKYLEKDDKFHYLKKNRRTIKVEYLFYDWNLNH